MEKMYKVLIVLTFFICLFLFSKWAYKVWPRHATVEQVGVCKGKLIAPNAIIINGNEGLWNFEGVCPEEKQEHFCSQPEISYDNTHPWKLIFSSTQSTTIPMKISTRFCYTKEKVRTN